MSDIHIYNVGEMDLYRAPNGDLFILKKGRNYDYPRNLKEAFETMLKKDWDGFFDAMVKNNEDRYTYANLAGNKAWNQQAQTWVHHDSEDATIYLFSERADARVPIGDGHWYLLSREYF